MWAPLMVATGLDILTKTAGLLFRTDGYGHRYNRHEKFCKLTGIQSNTKFDRDISIIEFDATNMVINNITVVKVKGKYFNFKDLCFPFADDVRGDATVIFTTFDDNFEFSKKYVFLAIRTHLTMQTKANPMVLDNKIIQLQFINSRRLQKRFRLQMKKCMQNTNMCNLN